MNLQNPFPNYVRNLYLGVWYCWECGGNGTNRGGLELHHIMGRNSNSALNSALLCGLCHKGMCHSQEEEQRLFLKTLKFLKSINYIFAPKDLLFMEDNKARLFSDEVIGWVNTL